MDAYCPMQAILYRIAQIIHGRDRPLDPPEQLRCDDDCTIFGTADECPVRLGLRACRTIVDKWEHPPTP